MWLRISGGRRLTEGESFRLESLQRKSEHKSAVLRVSMSIKYITIDAPWFRQSKISLEVPRVLHQLHSVEICKQVVRCRHLCAGKRKRRNMGPQATSRALALVTAFT